MITTTSDIEIIINDLTKEIERWKCKPNTIEVDCCEPKFKVGDVVYFMNGETPMKETITGTMVFVGEIIRSDGAIVRANKPSVNYHFTGIGKIDEQNVFSTIDELKEFVFKNF